MKAINLGSIFTVNSNMMTWGAFKVSPVENIGTKAHCSFAGAGNLKSWHVGELYTVLGTTSSTQKTGNILP